MSATTADHLGTDAYRPPAAEFLDKSHDSVEEKLFSRRGRLGIFSFHARATACLVILLIGAIPFAWCLLSSIYGSLNEALVFTTGALFFVTTVTSSVLYVITSIKQLHDLRLSGWEFLITLVPFAGVLWTVYYWFAKGQPEPNQYDVAVKTTPLEKVAGIGSFFLLVLLTLATASYFFGYYLRYSL